MSSNSDGQRASYSSNEDAGFIRAASLDGDSRLSSQRLTYRFSSLPKSSSSSSSASSARQSENEENRLRMAARRAAMTEDERRLEREKNRLRQYNRRMALSADALAQQREENRLRSRQRRAAMTEEQRKQARERNRIRNRLRRAGATTPELQQQLLEQQCNNAFDRLDYDGIGNIHGSQNDIWKNSLFDWKLFPDEDSKSKNSTWNAANNIPDNDPSVNDTMTLTQFLLSNNRLSPSDIKPSQLMMSPEFLSIRNTS